MSLRERIAKSELALGFVRGAISRYLRFCERTTDWQTKGLDEMKAAFDEGPILLVMWYSRMAMGAVH